MAVLRQKVEGVLETASNLMEINALEELPEGKQEVVEDQLWSILSYGEYYTKKLLTNLSKPILYLKSTGNFKFYQDTYKPLIQKTRALIELSNAPKRERIEIRIMEEIDPVPGGNLPSDINLYLDEYEDYALNGELTEWVKEHVKSHISDSDEHKSIEDCFDDVFHAVRLYQFDFDPGWNTMHTKILEDSERGVLGLDLSDYKTIISKPYFNPDGWVANEEDLDPVVVNQELKNIPTHIKQRINEIHHSFIFGNWMAVIALSRSLLEYAIIDNRTLLGGILEKEIQLTKKTKKIRNKPISYLVSCAAEAFPQLSTSMENIVDAGHEIMHPEKNVVPTDERVHSQAKECIANIRKIISTLYIKPKTTTSKPAAK